MLQNNPALEAKIEQLWNKFWSGGIANPLTAIEKKLPICSILLSRTMPSAMGTNASAPPCSLPSWPETGCFTGTTAPSELPTTLW